MKKSFRYRITSFAASVAALVALAMGTYNYFLLEDATTFALQKHEEALVDLAEDYLQNYTNARSKAIELDLLKSLSDLTIFGEVATKIIENKDQIYNLNLDQIELFQTSLNPFKGALITSDDAEFDVFIPTPFVDNSESLFNVKVFSLLNMVSPAIYKSSPNYKLTYFVADEVGHISKNYPNINGGKVLSSIVDGGEKLSFWKDWFPGNIDAWKKFYTDQDFQKSVLELSKTPVTFQDPYEDAGGQGQILTMFYPLWDQANNEFAGAAAIDVSLKEIIKNVLKISVAETGYSILSDSTGSIIAMSEKGLKDLKIEIKESKLGSLVYYRGNLMSSKDSGFTKAYEATLNQSSGVVQFQLDSGRDEIMAYTNLFVMNNNRYEPTNWKLTIVVPKDEILSSLFETQAVLDSEKENNVYIASAVAIVVTLVSILIASLIAGRISSDILVLSRAARQIAKKDYNVSVAVSSKDEIKDLADAFNTMSLEIKDYTENLESKVAERTAELSDANERIQELNESLKDENRRMSAELDVAKQLQMMVLPSDWEISQFKDVDIACFMSPADEVGGDYYDILHLDRGGMLIGIGDVTGHGLSSGVLMLMAQTAIRTLSNSDLDMREFINRVNTVLYENIQRINEDKNMTLALLHYQDGDYTVVGQHESVLVCRANGEIENIETFDLGLFVGMEKDISSFTKTHQFHLDKDDVMVLYTDGITEAINVKEEEFGIEGLQELLQKYHRLPSQEMSEKMRQDLMAYIGEAEIYDDITLVIFKQGK